MLDRRQLEGESLRSLAADIRDACSLAYQDLPPQAQERFCIQHFIDAIGDRDDRLRLSREKAPSLDEALSTACELEAFRLLETSKSKQWNMRTLSTEKENNMAAGAQATQQDLREKLEELKRQQEAQFSTLFGQIQQLLKDTTEKRDHPSQSRRNQLQSTPGRQPYREQAECWHCKEKGHLFIETTAGKRKEGTLECPEDCLTADEGQKENLNYSSAHNDCLRTSSLRLHGMYVKGFVENVCVHWLVDKGAAKSTLSRKIAK